MPFNYTFIGIIETPSKLVITYNPPYITSTCQARRTPPISASASIPNRANTKNHGHRRHPRLRRPRRRRKPRVRRHRPPTPNTLLGRRARRLRSPPMAGAANGADDGSRTDAGKLQLPDNQTDQLQKRPRNNANLLRYWNRLKPLKTSPPPQQTQIPPRQQPPTTRT